MIIDPGEALQRAVFQALRGNASLGEILATPGIYDRVPPPDPNETVATYQRRVPMPYVVIGEDEIIDDSTGCARAFECVTTIHVWSRAVGKVEAKSIGGAIIDALDAELDINGHKCTDFAFVNGRYFTDPDGLTTHGVLTFRYLLDPF